MEPLDPRASQLLEQIASAFRGVTLGKGVSLHETEVLDRYGTAKERREARAPDEKLDWRKLIDHPDLCEVHGVGGISFFDDLGLRFHLPAYLSMAIKHPEEVDVIEWLIFSLTRKGDWRDERCSILNSEQRAAVLAFLQWYRDEPGSDYYEPELSEATDGYWSEPAADGHP